MNGAKDLIEQIEHVNIVVDDLSLMTRFYRDVIGHEVYKTTTIQGEWLDELAGLDDVVADVVILSKGRGPNLELIKYRFPAGARPERRASPNTLGLRHIAYHVSDIEAVCRALGEAGVPFVSRIQDVPSDQFNIEGVRKRLVYFRDPEENLLEFCSYQK